MHLGGSPLPWFLPGVAISLVVSAVAARATGRAVGARSAVGWLVLFSLGVILAATLTPLREALRWGAVGSGSCDLGRWWPAIWSHDVGPSDIAGNVLMFIPFGLAIGLLPRSRRKSVIGAAAVALPFAIEAVQLLVPALDRACEAGDVVDNLTGLVLGLAAGTVAGRVSPRLSRGRE